MIIKIIGVGVIGAILSILLKQYRPDIAIAVPLLVTGVIFTACAPYIENVIEILWNIAEISKIELGKVAVVIKIIGVAYICQFASDICTDAGENAISRKIEFGGKLVIIVMSMPVIYSILDLVNEIINF